MGTSLGRSITMSVGWISNRGSQDMQKGSSWTKEVILISPISTGILECDRTANCAPIYVQFICDLLSVNQLTNHMYINGKGMKARIYWKPFYYVRFCLHLYINSLKTLTYLQVSNYLERERKVINSRLFRQGSPSILTLPKVCTINTFLLSITYEQR